MRTLNLSWSENWVLTFAIRTFVNLNEVFWLQELSDRSRRRVLFLVFRTRNLLYLFHTFSTRGDNSITVAIFLLFVRILFFNKQRIWSRFTKSLYFVVMLTKTRWTLPDFDVPSEQIDYFTQRKGRELLFWRMNFISFLRSKWK